MFPPQRKLCVSCYFAQNNLITLMGNVKHDQLFKGITELGRKELEFPVVENSQGHLCIFHLLLDDPEKSLGVEFQGKRR